MQPIRLKLHYNYLNNFDFTDRDLQISKSIVFIPKLHTLIIRSKTDKYLLLKNAMIKSLVLEILSSQRFFIGKIEKTLFKNLFFELTLRKKNLLLFLENCLNTAFLNEWTSILGNINVENKLHFYLNSNLINHFVLTTSQFKYSVQIFKSFTSSKKANEWSFYLIPNKH